MKRFDLLIFDCDGVLVDSEPIGNRVLAEVIKSYGVLLSPEEARHKFVGKSVAAIRAELHSEYGLLLPADWTEEYYRNVILELGRYATPIRGVTEICEWLVAEKIPFCCASQGPLEKIRASLTSAGLWQWFEGKVFSAKSVARSKPAPDIFLYAAKNFGIEAVRCAVIEDSQTGVIAALDARMAAFAYCDEMDAAIMLKLGAIPFNDMAQIRQFIKN